MSRELADACARLGDVLLQLPEDLTPESPDDRVDHAGVALVMVATFAGLRRGVSASDVLRYTLEEYEAGIFANQLDNFRGTDIR